jgi:hypothetical protein
MIVYQPRPVEGYQWVLPTVRHASLAIRKVLNAEPGKSAANRWIPPHVRLLHEDEGQHLRPADMPWCNSSVIAVTERARPVLEELLAGDAEFLPLDCDEEQLWLVHPWRIVDALDEERSELERFTSSDRVMTVTRYVFREAALGGVACFKVPQMIAPMFVTEGVVAAIRGNGLTGVRFQRLWQSPALPDSEANNR